ncbi:MAG: DinB family protein [Saprospiraceae bacterium]
MNFNFLPNVRAGQGGARQKALPLVAFPILLLLFFHSTPLGGQPVTNDHLLGAWDTMTEMVIETARKMPAEAYGYRPAESIRSFAEQINHVTMSNIGLGSMVFGKMPTFALPNRKNPPTEKEKVIDILEKSFAYFKENLQSFKAEDLEKTVKWGPPQNQREVTKLQGLLMIYSHMQLEYGKLTVYARMKGIEPHPSGGWSF